MLYIIIIVIILILLFIIFKRRNENFRDADLLLNKDYNNDNINPDNGMGNLYEWEARSGYGSIYDDCFFNGYPFIDSAI